MSLILRKLFFSLLIIASYSRASGQCTPKTIEFLGGERIFNSACGNSSYQNIKG